MKQEKKKCAPLLEVEHLSVSFIQYERGWKRRKISPIRDMSLRLSAGELTAVVGASGSGKSLLAHAVLGLLPYNASCGGTIRYDGEILDEKRLERLRGREIVLVPQSVSYLDPLMRAGDQVRKGKKDAASREKCRNALARYGLGPETEKLYPFELSGGMTRRILIAAAVQEKPRLVIADEPTPGLHLEAAKRVMGHFREIADDGAAVLMITHDLELALETADRIVVFHDGETIEECAPADFLEEGRLSKEYTKALYRAMPQNSFSGKAETERLVPGSLKASGISFRYDNRDRQILNRVNLEIKGGERLGLIAPSGFGKTTFCRILAGYEKPDSGQVLLDDRLLSEYEGCCPVQMIWQHPELAVNPRMKLREVLKEGGEIPDRIVKELGIRGEWLDRFPSELSGGELQRFCIARALGERTRFLLADEISTMLDLITQSQLWHFLIEETRRRGIGMLVVSHSEPLLERICSRKINLWEDKKAWT